MGPVPAVSQPVKKKKYSKKISHAATPRPPLPFPHFLPSPPRLQPSPPRRSNRPLLSAALVRTAPEPPPPPDHPFSRGAPIRSDPIPRLPSLPVFPPCINRGIGGIGRKLRNPPRLFAGLAWIRTRPESLSILSTTVSFDSLESRLAGVVLVLAVSVALLVTVLCRQ
jgi:hypothetical protein